MKPTLIIVAYLACVGVYTDDVFAEDEIDQKIENAIEKAESNVEAIEVTDTEKHREGVDKVEKESANGQLALFAAPTGLAKKLAKEASIELAALKELFSMEDLDNHRLRANKTYLELWKEKFRKYCPYSGTCERATYYRSADGTCNNAKNPTWGASLSPQSREIPPMYDDGIDAPRIRDRLGLPLPSARAVSNAVHKAEGTSPRNQRLTMMVMQWGQFIDHDFVSTPVLKGENGANIECCGEENEDRPQCFPIQIPDDDPFFNKTCIGFVRSAPALKEDCSPGHREQMNQVTSFIDGSAVYGSTLNDTNFLREMTGGLLRTLNTANTHGGDMLPKGSDSKCRLTTAEDYCQRAGDVRVNVVPSLGWSHTCFFREHNRIARELAEINPHWDDETIFQQARRILAAIEQIINYNEYLPAILNAETMAKYGLNLETTGYRRNYNKKVNPAIANSFAAATFRFGHSQIANYQAIMNSQYEFVEKKPIETTYHRPHMVIRENGIALDGMARWLIADPVPLADGLFEDGVRNKLFLDNKGSSLDLPMLNIQRGRDHGIPAYNQWRVHCDLEKATMTDGGEFILPDHRENETRNLEHVYRHVDDIDLFTGAMTEILLGNSSVGPTFACLLGRQFSRLMIGDSYWHETDDPFIRFTTDQLAELRNATLARLICNNFDVDELQPRVFLIPGPGNERVGCDNLPDIDLDKWKSYTGPRPDGRPKFISKTRVNRGRPRG